MYEYWVTEAKWASLPANNQMMFLNDMARENWEYVSTNPDGRFILRKNREN